LLGTGLKAGVNDTSDHAERHSTGLEAAPFAQPEEGEDLFVDLAHRN
jgi:hypothetical protein